MSRAIQSFQNYLPPVFSTLYFANCWAFIDFVWDIWSDFDEIPIYGFVVTNELKRSVLFSVEGNHALVVRECAYLLHPRLAIYNNIIWIFLLEPGQDPCTCAWGFSLSGRGLSLGRSETVKFAPTMLRIYVKYVINTLRPKLGSCKLCLVGRWGFSVFLMLKRLSTQSAIS